MTKLSHLAKNLFYPPGNAVRLGRARFIFFLGFLTLGFRLQLHYYSIPPVALMSDYSYFPYLSFSRPDVEVFKALTLLWKLSLLTSAVGLLTQVSTVVACFLGMFLLGYHIAFTPSDFHYQLPVLVAGVFMFSRCGDAFSLDARFFKRKGQLNAHAYGWPFRLMILLLCLMYFKAGVSKLRFSGLEWVEPQVYWNHVAYIRTVLPFYLVGFSHAIVQFLDGHPFYIRALGWLTLIIELFSLLPFFLFRTLKTFGVLWIGFHLAVYCFTGIWASIWFIPIYLALIPWDRIQFKGRFYGL